uniref:Uncharacterized protein n=1 Tax=Arion vulgaris TaxID=1028688 RepID=A0A0B7BZ49_9EUPU
MCIYGDASKTDFYGVVVEILVFMCVIITHCFERPAGNSINVHIIYKETVCMKI